MDSAFDGRSVDKEAIAKVPVQMIVGGEDTKPDNPGAFWDWVHATLDEQEDLMLREKGRLETLKDLRDDWEANGIRVGFEVVEGVAHESDGVRSSVLRWLKPLVRGTLRK